MFSRRLGQSYVDWYLINWKQQSVAPLIYSLFKVPLFCTYSSRFHTFIKANYCFSNFVLAFTFLFAVMEPVPWQLKIAFHFFGFGSLILGMVLFASTLASEFCVSISFVNNQAFMYARRQAMAILTSNLQVTALFIPRGSSSLVRPNNI